MNVNNRTNHQLRLKAFDCLMKFKQKDISRKIIVKSINKQFGVSIQTLYCWYSGRNYPHGRKGIIFYKPELFYVLGALLGDGCSYRWRITNNYNILVGDKEFAKKYSFVLNECTNKKVKPYIDRTKNIWFVRSNNFELYSLFEKVREDLSIIEKMSENYGTEHSLLFVEGFFDAEGCVKIIKEKERKTPKICLDIANTNYDVLEFIRKILMDSLSIEARYSVQKPFVGKDGSKRRTLYHLRIYKKEHIRAFLENIHTTKLMEHKIHYVKNWIKEIKIKRRS